MRALTLWFPLGGFNPFQSLRDRNTNSHKIKEFAFASVSRGRHDSCDARVSQEKNLHNDSSSLIGHLAADTFNFFLAVLTQEVEAHAVAIGFLDVVVKTVAQDKILRTGEVAFKHTVLHPLAKALQNAMNAATTFIIFNIIGHHHIHRAAPAKYEAECPTSGTHRWVVLDGP